MHSTPNKRILSLLVHAYNNPIKDFYYFPEVIFIGEQKALREDFDLLLSESFIEEYDHDSFGRFYRLSKKAESYIYEAIVLRKHFRKRKLSTEKQTCIF